MRVRDRCPACGGGSKIRYRCRFTDPPISDFIRSFYGRDPPTGEYRVEQCSDCGIYFQAEIGSDDLLSEIYGNWISEPDEGVSQRDRNEIISAASFLGLPLTAMETLDYGMGWASWARAALELGCRSHGFDIVPERMAFARSHGIEPDTGRYHFINMEQVLEHIDQPAEVVERLAKSLHPGGILKISVPSPYGVEAFFKNPTTPPMPIAPLEHINTFTASGLKQLGERFGLQPVKPSYRHRYAFLPSGNLKELVRPFYQWRNPRNLYVWFRRPQPSQRRS